MKSRVVIYRFPKDPRDDLPAENSFPWYYKEWYHEDDRDEHGSVATFAEAMTVAHNVIRSREEQDA